MKRTTQFIKIIGLTFFLGCTTSPAADWLNNFYVNADVGPAFIPDTATHGRQSFDGDLPVAFKGRMSFDPGIRGNLTLGHRLTKSWAVELEAGVICNTFTGFHDEFYQIPVMLKVRYEIPLSNSWKAYIGAGAGEVTSSFNDEIPDPAFHTPYRFNQTDTAFGYEAEAGIKYSLSHRIDLGLGYSFLGVDQFNYHVNAPGLVTANVTADDVFTHTALVSFTWKF